MTEQTYTGFPTTDEAERERMLNLVHPLTQMRKDKSEITKAERTASDMLRAYLSAQPEPWIWDGEHGEGFKHTTVGEGRSLDHSGITPAQLWALADEGCLNLAVGRWDGLCDRAQATGKPELLDLVAAVRPHVHPIEGSRLVQIKEEPR